MTAPPGFGRTQPQAPAPAGAQIGWLRTDDGLLLRWLEWGPADAPVLVMLHGLRSYAATFEGLAQRLSGSWRCVALDARGRGGSDWDPRRDYHSDRYVADLSHLVDRLDHRVALLGHSMGGATAMVWAAAHTERVSALIIEDMLPGSSLTGTGAERIRREVASTPAGFADVDAAVAYWRGLRPTASDEAIRSRVHNTTRRISPGRPELEWIPDMAGIGAARLDAAQPPADLRPTIALLPGRTLIIRGGDSDFTDSSTLHRVRQINPAITVMTIERAGHYVHDDQPERFADCVETFLTAGG